jgi:hypothetical protein
MLHWLVAYVLGLSSAVGSHNLVIDASIATRDYLAVAAAGPLITIAYAVVGQAIYRSESLTAKRMGFVLVFVNGIGRILYAFSGFFADMATDEAEIAYRIGIPACTLSLPVTLFCALSLVVVLTDNETGLKRKRPLIALSVGLLAGIGQVLAMGALVNTLQTTGHVLFQPVLSGYVPAVAIVNLILVLTLGFVVRYEIRLERSSAPREKRPRVT